MQKRTFTDFQLVQFRGLQGLLLQRAESNSSDDLMQLQVKIEAWISKQMDIAVTSALASINQLYAGMPGYKLSVVQIVEFRERQAKSFLIAQEGDFNKWARYQTEIEQWVEEQIDKEILNETQKFIRLGGSNLN